MQKEYENIKELLINNEVYKKVKDYNKNCNDLETYYKVGEELSKAGKHYGEGIIKIYSKRLSEELKVKYTKSSLYNMLNFYNFSQKFQTMSGKLSWSHYCELLKLKNHSEIIYYIKLVEVNHLTIRELRNRIKSQEYERLPEETKNKLIAKQNTTIKDLIPNPIVITNEENNKEKMTEKILHQIILGNIERFMKQLGNGYTFVGSEYKIKIGDRYNYIDLLLYNIKFNCYVVIELKVTELKKEYIGQIELYMNYIDKNLKEITQNKTIGIIICKKNNKYVIEYCSNPHIISREYLVI